MKLIPYLQNKYIIAVNRNNEVVEKSFNTNYPDGFVDVLYENRQLNIDHRGIFSDIFQPFDTNIYLISSYERLD